MVRRPSLSVCITGLMESMVPTSAVAAETRPPRFRKFRSSTVNQWQTWSLLSSTQSPSWLRVRPSFFF